MQPVKTKKKLSRTDKKQIEAAIARANRTDKKGKSAQDSIPYERMWPDGICRISDSHYTKTIQFQDINYQLSQNEGIQFRSAAVLCNGKNPCHIGKQHIGSVL